MRKRKSLDGSQKNKFVSLSIIQNNHYYRYRNLKITEIKKSPTKVGAKENEVLITYTMFMLSYYLIAFITSDLTN